MLSPQYQKLVPRTQSEVTVKQYFKSLIDYHPVYGSLNQTSTILIFLGKYLLGLRKKRLQKLTSLSVCLSDKSFFLS